MTDKGFEENVDEACSELRRAAGLVRKKYGGCELEICFVAEEDPDGPEGMVNRRQTGEITINVKRG